METSSNLHPVVNDIIKTFEDLSIEGNKAPIENTECQDHYDEDTECQDHYDEKNITDSDPDNKNNIFNSQRVTLGTDCWDFVNKHYPQFKIDIRRMELGPDQDNIIIEEISRYLNVSRDLIKIVLVGNAFTIIIVDPDVFQLIKYHLSKNHYLETYRPIPICGNYYGIQTNFRMIECHKCQRFGHTTKKCRSKQWYCPTCSGPHLDRECSNNYVYCWLCRNEIDNKHRPRDQYRCKKFKEYIAKERKRTVYKHPKSNN